MNKQSFRITFKPHDKTINILPGTSIIEAAGEAGIIIRNPCGGNGTCNKCLVQIISGEYESFADPNFPKKLKKENYCLACKTYMKSDGIINIPEKSVLDFHKILSKSRGRKCSCKPAVKKVYFELKPPKREDAESDQARFLKAVGKVSMSLEQIRKLPDFLRHNKWQGTAVVTSRKLLSLERDNTTENIYGIAFDLGSTSIVGTLLDLKECSEKGSMSSLNPQISYGNDIIARITSIISEPRNLDIMRIDVIKTFNDIIDQLANKFKIKKDNIYHITVAGNAAMQQIFCGINPSSLGIVPFTQVFDNGLNVSASELGIKANPEALVYVFPQIGGFVGGDTVAGLVGINILKEKKTVLFVDIGTNGEIVLKHKDQYFATSTAAGPALEGAKIKQGMRGAAGAIEKVIYKNGDIDINTIGNRKPMGICGSGLIDALACLLRLGVVDITGKIISSENLTNSVTKKIKERIKENSEGLKFILAKADESANREQICLWQKDISELLLAIGAIKSGIMVLSKRAGINIEDIDEVLLAGAFGNFIRRSNAQRVGLLPPISHDKISFVGNSASEGAKLVLLSEIHQKEAERIRNLVHHIDLSLDPEFNDYFANSMMFPES